MICENTLEHANQERAHFYSTCALYSLYVGDFCAAIESANSCLSECLPDKISIEKSLFKSTALQVLAACYLFDGDEVGAYEACMESLTIAKQSGYKRSIAVSKGYLSAICCVKKEYDLAEQLIAQSIELVSDEDIAMPSLLGIGLFVYGKTHNNTQYRACLERINTTSKPNTILNTFALYQQSLKDLERGDAHAAAVKMARVRDALQKLQLLFWQAWV